MSESNSKKVATMIVVLGIGLLLGYFMFNESVRRTRDAKRQQDMYSLASALESHYILSYPDCLVKSEKTIKDSSFCPFRTDWFYGGEIPQDPLKERSYCIASNTDGKYIPNINISDWPAVLISCPKIAGFNWQEVTPSSPGLDKVIKAWKICTRFEDTEGIFCLPSQQQ